MNRFLVRFAVNHRKAGVSNTWVLTEIPPNESAKLPVAAYFNLTFGTVRRDEIPAQGSSPKYPVPVIVLARLAVDQRFQGRGLGEKTLVFALRKAASLMESTAMGIGLIIDVLDPDALAFYQRFELFEPFTEDPMRLLVSRHVVRRI